MTSHSAPRNASGSWLLNETYFYGGEAMDDGNSCERQEEHLGYLSTVNNFTVRSWDISKLIH